MTGYKLLPVIDDPRDVRPVDCGTCPVTLACALDRGGNGFTFQCCGATGFLTSDEEGEVLLMLDCGRHKFEVNNIVDSMPLCPLCSSVIVETTLEGLGTRSRWVPTVHAKVPWQDRIKAWRVELPRAQERVATRARRKTG